MLLFFLSVRRILFLLLFIWFYISGFRAIDVQRPKEITVHFKPATQVLIEENRLMNLISAKQRILNKPLPLVAWSKLENQLKDLPQVKDAQFYLKKPHLIQLDLTFHKTIYHVNRNGKVYLLNENLNLMPPSPFIVFNLPIIHILDQNSTKLSSDSLIPLKLKPYAAILNFIHKDAFWSKWIADIVINQKGEVTLYPEVGQFKVLLGKNFTPENLERLFLLLKYGLSYIEWKKVEAIDLRFQNQIVIRMKTKNQSKI